MAASYSALTFRYAAVPFRTSRTVYPCCLSTLCHRVSAATFLISQVERNEESELFCD